MIFVYATVLRLEKNGRVVWQFLTFVKLINFTDMTTGKSMRSVIDRFQGKTVLILGDVMIDSYLFGKVERISPEAPVPVVALHQRENRLGGAANVALNIQALGAVPVLCSVIGEDRQGDIFLELLKNLNLADQGILRSRDRITTTKFRVIGNKVQMLRVDEEQTHDLDKTDEKRYIEVLSSLITTLKVDAIILQDYNKGVLTPEFIRQSIRLAREKNIPVCVDPKKKNFDEYKGVTLFKPNLKELKEGLGRDFDHKDKESLAKGIASFQEEQLIELLMVTLSEEGIFIRQRNDGELHLVPAHKRSIADVSGAGDTVISMAALCLATGCSPRDLALLSNLAGGLVCEEVGVVPVDLQKLLREMEILAL